MYPGQQDPQARRERTPFHGWRFAAIGACMNGLIAGLYGRGFSVYFLALANDLKLSHASTSLVFGLSALESGLQSPITGYFIDRWGPRIMMMIGAVVAGVGFLLLPLANSYTVFLIIFIGVLSLGVNMGFHNGSAVIVTRWFIRNRGTAFGVISVGIAAGGAVFTPAVAYIVINHGWRTAAFVSGIAILLLGVPLAALVRNSPEELGQTPDGDGGPGSRRLRQVPVEYGVREATRTWAYWLLSIGVTLRISAGSGVIVHIVPLMVWKGLGEEAGGVVIATGSLAAIATRFFMGWLGDRWSKRKIVISAMLVGAGSLVFLLYAPGKLPLMIAFGVILSITEGAAGLTWAMIGDYFGRSSYATIRGSVNTMVSLGALAAPVAAGRVFDITASYFWVLASGAVIYIMAAAVFLVLRGPRRQEGRA